MTAIWPSERATRPSTTTGFRMRHSLGKLLEDSLCGFKVSLKRCYLGVQRVDYLASEGAPVANQKVVRFRCSPMWACYLGAMRTMPRCDH
jgi:hypothetical protein